MILPPARRPTRRNLPSVRDRIVVVLALVLLLPAACVCAAEAAGAGAGSAGHATISPSLREIDSWGEHARTAKIMLVLLQVAAILAAAKLLGWLAERVRVPGVVGELAAGIVIGPYVLGPHILLPLAGHRAPLFPAPTAAGEWPVNDVIWSLSQVASIVLLFVTGLHTNLQQFLRYVGPATLVAVVGLVAPFALGFVVVYYGPFTDLARGSAGASLLVPALFVGAILAATSIGITARVLGDLGQLETPEGVTILGAAVLDDVLGIIALAVIGGIASAGTVSLGTVGAVAGKAFGFWVGLTGVVLLLAGPLERAIGRIRYAGAMVGLGLALAFLCSALAEGFGLAFIIGAYSVGLGLSRTEMAHKLMDKLQPINDFVVPIFFAALGMLVNLKVMLASWQVVAFGLAVTAAAVVGKLVGCGAAALPTGFNARGAYRIGLGMLPRGEVALIVAGIGLSRQIVGEVVFGVSIMMTLITTVIAPVLLVPAFSRGGTGRRTPEHRPGRLPSPSVEPALDVSVPPGLVGDFVDRFLETAERAGWEPAYDKADEEMYLLRSRGDALQVTVNPDKSLVRIDASDARQPELLPLIEQVRRSLIADAERVAVAARSPGVGGPPRPAV